VVACNSSIQFIHLLIAFSDVATLARDIRHKILLRVSIMTKLLTCRRASGLTTLQHFLRPNKLFDSFIMKLLHVLQLVRITCAAVRHKNCGGFSKFRLAWRRAKFFPAAAAWQGAGWLRRRNSTAEGSSNMFRLIDVVTLC